MFVLAGADQSRDAGVFRLTGIPMHGGMQLRRDTESKGAKKGCGKEYGNEGSRPRMLL